MIKSKPLTCIVQQATDQGAPPLDESAAALLEKYGLGTQYYEAASDQLTGDAHANLVRMYRGPSALVYGSPAKQPTARGRPPRAPRAREVRRQTFDGCVKRIEGGTATVLLECDGQRQLRTMRAGQLAGSGIRVEGQAFTLVVCELRRPDGRFRTQIDLEPVGDPEKRTVKPIRLNADFSRFKDM